MLPGLAGDEVCRRLRQEGVLTPILMLTAKDGVSDETGAFDAGADDYLRKPFEFAVLIARCDSLVRRQSRGSWSDITFGDLVLDPRRRIVPRGTAGLALSRRASAVCASLLCAKWDLTAQDDPPRDAWCPR